MNVIEPFDVRHAVPSRHNQSDRRAVCRNQRQSIHFPADQEVGFRGVVGGHAASKVLFHHLRSASVCDGFHSLVPPKEHHFPSVRRGPASRSSTLRLVPPHRAFPQSRL